jgi:hypothetical protein
LLDRAAHGVTWKANSEGRQALAGMVCLVRSLTEAAAVAAAYTFIDEFLPGERGKPRTARRTARPESAAGPRGMREHAA